MSSADVEEETVFIHNKKNLWASTPVKRSMSESERPSISNTNNLVAPRCISWIEWPFRVSAPDLNLRLDEATGWGMDAVARGPLNQVGIFVGSAILRSAAEEAGCSRPAGCKAKVYGVRPSSLLSIASVIIVVASALLMPIVGSITDHTHHRKTLGVTTAAVVSITAGLQIILLKHSWFAVLILEIIGGFSLIAHYTAVLAYLPDLSSQDSHLSHYTARFNALKYAGQALFMAFVVPLSHITSSDPTQTARIGLIIAFCNGVLFFTYSWTFLFRHREPLSTVPQGSSLLTTSFKKVFSTGKRIVSEFTNLRWFMFSLFWSPESGSGVALSIATTFLTVTLDMNSIELGVVSIILLTSQIVGSLVSKRFCNEFNPMRSFQSALAVYAMTVVITAIAISSPKQKNPVYFLVFFWGVAIGWLYPSQRVLFCTMIPKGQETEFMGVFTFCGQILGWMPVFLFSLMNERGVEMRWGLCLIPLFLLASLMCTLPINYSQAVAQVGNRTDGDKDVGGTVTSSSVVIAQCQPKSDNDSIGFIDDDCCVRSNDQENAEHCKIDFH